MIAKKSPHTTGSPGGCQQRRVRARTPHVILPEIHWVHRPDALRRQIDEAFDLCPDCAEARAEEYKAKYPDHAADICKDGGWGSESETLPLCDRCNTELGCYLINGVEAIERWGEKSRCINTLADWLRAHRRLSSPPVPALAQSGGEKTQPKEKTDE